MRGLEVRYRLGVRFWRERSGPGWRVARRRRGLEIGSVGSGSTWIGVGVAFAVVVLLGVIGFTRYQQAAGAIESIPTRLYQSLQLFVLEGGSVSGPVPWELNVARFAAPMVAAYALLRVLTAVMHEQSGLLRLTSVRERVIVAGLGRKGTLLAQALLDRGGRVVAVEVDAANPALEKVRAMGGLVVVGDARSPATLQRVGAGRLGGHPAAVL